MDLARREFGEQGPPFDRSITGLARALQGGGRYQEAEPLFRRSLAIREQALGVDNPGVALSVNNLAVLLLWEGRYPEAESLFRRALRLRQSGPEGPELAESLNGLGNVLQAAGRYGEAEPLQRRALSIREKVLGAEAPDVAESLFNLAALLREEGRYTEAEPISRRSAAIREKVFGPNHPGYSASLNDLATILARMGRYNEAESLFRRSVAIDENWNPQHPDVAATLNNLAGIYELQGRLDDAEREYHRALSIDETVLGPQHPSVAAVLGNIVQLLQREGRYEDAEPIARRALDIDERALGPGHPETASSVDNLASVLSIWADTGMPKRFIGARSEIRERAFGGEHIVLAVSLHNLGRLLIDQGRYKDAEAFLRQALEIRAKLIGPNADDTAVAVNDLAAVYGLEGRYGDAEALYRRALAIEEKALGPANPNLATTLFNLGATITREHRDADALPAFRRATAILAAQPFWGSDKAVRARVREARPFYFGYAALAARLIAAGHPEARALGDEAFAALQWMKASDTGAAVSHMAARFGAGSDALASLLRTQQDAQAKLDAIRAAILHAEGLPDSERNADSEAKLQADADTLGQELQHLDEAVAAKFPAYAELANPRPISVAETQALLAPGEALVVVVTDPSGSVVSVITHGDGALRHVDMGVDALTALVKKLRGGLVAGGPAIPEFPAAAAWDLYRNLFRPVEGDLKGVRHIIFVGDGALESLPLSVLLTEPPSAEAVKDSGRVARASLVLSPLCGDCSAIRVRAQGAPSIGVPLEGVQTVPRRRRPPAQASPAGGRASPDHRRRGRRAGRPRRLSRRSGRCRIFALASVVARNGRRTRSRSANVACNGGFTASPGEGNGDGGEAGRPNEPSHHRLRDPCSPR